MDVKITPVPQVEAFLPLVAFLYIVLASSVIHRHYPSFYQQFLHFVILVNSSYKRLE